MKARIIEQPARVYREADLNSPSIADLQVGTEVELGAVKKKHGTEWVAVTLSDGQRGYVPGETRIYQIKEATLLQKTVDVHAEPSLQAPVTVQYKKNDRFWIVQYKKNDRFCLVKQGEEEWVKIRDSAGNEGFIAGDTKINVVQEEPVATKGAGGKNMLFGAMWCIGGTVVTAVTYSEASSEGGTYIIAWGAIVFGALQFLKGVWQVLTASD
ncbi:MAG: hypothetical protein A2Y76_03575 [Planctomycetes bacterium RBG_13_60_9]|nr:MAG: hypothetical protein A2Y76_03575 [Planctomycetes bacterium RBG_13_60_9]